MWEKFYFPQIIKSFSIRFPVSLMTNMAVLAYFRNKETHVQGIKNQKFGLWIIKEASKK